MRLEGKVIIITGASEGIGAACAAAFRASGARLSLNARSEDRLRMAAGANDVITAGDITDAEVRRQVVDRTLERFARIDVLLNCAGMGLYTPAWRAPMADVRRMYELNYFAPLGLIQLVVPHMQRHRSGTIVNVSSIAGKVTLPWLTVYSTSKYALCSLTDGLRMELKRDGIHAMTVCPGYVNTQFQAHALGSRPPEKMLKGKRFAATAEQCAEAIARGVERGARTVVTPRIGWIFIALERLLPWLVDAQMTAMNEEAPA